MKLKIKRNKKDVLSKDKRKSIELKENDVISVDEKLLTLIEEFKENNKNGDLNLLNWNTRFLTKIKASKSLKNYKIVNVLHINKDNSLEFAPGIFSENAVMYTIKAKNYIKYVKHVEKIVYPDLSYDLTVITHELLPCTININSPDISNELENEVNKLMHDWILIRDDEIKKAITGIGADISTQKFLVIFGVLIGIVISFIVFIFI